MTHLRSFCQLKFPILFVLILFSCSTKKDVKKNRVLELRSEEVSSIAPKWFDVRPDFAFFVTRNLRPDSPVVHLFFDPPHHYDEKLNQIDVVRTTPQDSPYRFEIDLTSGQIFKKWNYCKQKDLWKNYGSQLKFPPFHLAIVPQIYDVQKNPQRVIVFGDEKYFTKFAPNKMEADRIRIVGGVVEERCPHFPCQSQEDWHKSLILVGVHPSDDSFKEIKSVFDLKKEIDWAEVVAFLENGDGHLYTGENFYPSTRIVREMSLANSQKMLQSDSHFWTQEEMNQFKSGCIKLSDDAWTMYESTKNHRGEFIPKFIDFYLTQGENFYQCQRQFRMSNPRSEILRHWYTTYLSAVFILKHHQYSFDGGRGAWIENPVLSSGKRLFKEGDLLKATPASKFDRIFEMAINSLKTMNNISRYYEYDDSWNGTHQLLYSWVENDGRKLTCSDSEDGPTRDFFPSDVSWPTLFDREALEKEKFIR